MIFKKNNPGCPCCNCPCSCYKFDENASDCAGNNDLTETDTPAYDASTKLLGEQSAKFDSSGYFEHAHKSCFSPSANPEGWAMWFWIKSLVNTSGTSLGSDPNAITYYPGVITKGHYTYRRDQSSFACDSLSASWNKDAGESKGEWMVNMLGNDIVFHVHTKNTILANGNCGASENKFLPVGGQAVAATSEWTFFYWYIKGNDSWLFAYNESGFIDRFHENLSTPVGTSSNAGGIEANGDESLRIGTHAAKSNSGGTITDGPEQRLGEATNGGKFRIDNVGFCSKPDDYGDADDPSPTPIVRPTAADNLWNEGVGRACPYGGK